MTTQTSAVAALGSAVRELAAAPHDTETGERP